MRILMIRHGDPDYTRDSLTVRGRHEAELLACRLVHEPIDAIWCSTMGRARETCAPTAQALRLVPHCRDWLREIPYPVSFEEYPNRPYWFSFPPHTWENLPGFDHAEDWKKLPMFAESGVVPYVENVCRQFDALLSCYGYIRHGHYFELLPGRRDVCLAFFCHQGLLTALTAHLCGVPMPMLWNLTMAPTSSVTTFVMDRIRPDEPVAVPRMISFGDTGHLYAGGERPNWRGLHHEITP